MLYRIPFLAVLSLLASPLASAAPLAATSEDMALVQSLANELIACVEQPYGVNSRTGNKAYGTLRSRCASVEIAGDRVQMLHEGRLYTLLVKESELSDGGDLTDFFVQYDSREDREVLVASHLLSYSDPALATLLVGGYAPDRVPEIADPSIK
jgi:hypothetical protein